MIVVFGGYILISLVQLASKIDTTKMNAPSFLMILTGTSKYAIRREDGVYVVQIIKGVLQNL